MTYKLITALCFSIITATVVFTVVKNRKKIKRKLVSEEGYETAYDILFPVKYKKYRPA
jgi:large-conductance mechanosensitive channel